MIPRVQYPSSVPKLPEPSRLKANVSVPPAPIEAPSSAPEPIVGQDAMPISPQNPQYQRVIERNAPSEMPTVPRASLDFKSRLRYGAISAIQNMANTAASIPKISDVPLDGPETLLGGLGAGIGAAVNPQGYEEQKYRRETLPRFQEQEKYKTGIRDAAIKAQKSEADVWNTRAQAQQHQATTEKTQADTATTQTKLPYVRNKEELAVKTSEQELGNKRQQGVNLALEPERIGVNIKKTKADTALTESLTPERVKAEQLKNEGKAFENKVAPQKLQTETELKKSQITRNLNPRTGTGKIDTQGAKDKALTDWNTSGEKEAKLKFFQEEYKKIVAQNPTFANEKSEVKVSSLERRWNKVKDKFQKEYVENKSLDNRNSQRNASGTMKGADVNKILYGTR